MSKSIRRRTISVVIPTYNREMTIARAVESALSQQYAPGEIIVVDDGSTDGTRAIVDRYHGDVRCLYQSNGGVSAARNAGVMDARSDWIAFLDSDDYWRPDHLGRLAEAIEATNEEGALYFGNAIWRDNEGETSYWDLCNFRIKGSYEVKKDAIEWAFMHRQPMLLQSSIIKRSRYLEVGILPEGLVVQEDTLLFYRFTLLDTVCAVSEFGAVLGRDHTNERLTATYSSRTSRYWNCSVAVFKDLDTYKDRMTIRWRKAVKDRLIASYIALAHALVREGKVGTALSEVIKAMGLGPRESIHRLFEHFLLFVKNRLTNGGAVERLEPGRR